MWSAAKGIGTSIEYVRYVFAAAAPRAASPRESGVDVGASGACSERRAAGAAAAAAAATA
jgi:hypothetical protein